MSNLSQPMIRRSERGPRAEMDGGKDPSSGSNTQPHEMESHLISSDATTESQDTDSSDELTEPVAAEMSPSVSGSPGVRMGVSGNAIPVPEVEPEDPVEPNTVDRRSVINDLSPANALIALNRSAPRQDLSLGQIPIGSPSEENVAVCPSMSVSAVPMSVDVNMPVLVHAYAPIASPGQPSGADQAMPSSSEFQSLVGLLNTVATDVKTARNDASLRSAEMFEILSDVEGKMLQRESHFMSEIEARNAQQQEVMHAYQESLRSQVSELTQQQTIMQVQVTRQREEVQSMERRLKDEFFSRIDSFAEAIRPAPAVTSIESNVNECMHGANEASERLGPRFDGSFCSMKVSNSPVETEALSGADAAASEIGYNTYSTQPPPHSGYGSRGREPVAILGLDESSVAASIERQQGTRPERLWVLDATRCEVQDNKNKKNNQMLW